MSSLHNFINIRNLTLEQQRVYVMYVNQYDLISNQIDTLHEMLYDIRANISDLQTNNNNNNNNNINMQNIYNYPNIISHTNTSTRNTTSQSNNLIERFITNLFNTPITNNSQINNLRPTPEQINNASRLVRYDVIENPSSEMCTISLQEFNDADQVRQILYCGHIFHENSLQEWFTRNTVCPLCRYDIRNYVRNDIQPSQNSQVNNTPNSVPNGINLLLSNLTGMDVEANDVNFVLSNFSRMNIDINSPQIISIVDEITRLMIPQNANTNANTDDVSISSYFDSDSDAYSDDITI